MRRLDRILTVLLFAAGAAAWIWFFGAGRVPLDFHDWAAITVPRLSFMQQSLRAGELPLHMAHSDALHGVTERFLSLPDVITTPQMVLLLWLPIPAFVVADVLIHYAIGCAGLVLLRRYFDWSIVTFAAVFLLVMFNGHILAHYTVGHFTWGPYFLFPIVAWLLCRFFDGQAGWRWVAMFAATMCYMVLAGGEHHVTWVLILLALLVPFAGPRRWWLVAAGAASALLSAVRLLPPALELQSFEQVGFITDVLGYPSVWHLLQSLVVLRRELPDVAKSGLPANLWFFDHNNWEFNLYVGTAGAVVLGYGVYRWLREETPRYCQLIVPIGVMIIISMGSVYRLPRALGIPLLQGERVTARMLGLVLVLLIVVCAAQLDPLVRRGLQSWRSRIAMLGALALLAIDIAASIRLQRLAVSNGLFGPSPLNPSVPTHYADPLYTSTLAVGLSVTMVTAVVLTVLALRERRRPHDQRPAS